MQSRSSKLECKNSWYFCCGFFLSFKIQNNLEIISERRTYHLNYVTGLDLKIVIKELVPIDELKSCRQLKRTKMNKWLNKSSNVGWLSCMFYNKLSPKLWNGSRTWYYVRLSQKAGLLNTDAIFFLRKCLQVLLLANDYFAFCSFLISLYLWKPVYKNRRLLIDMIKQVHLDMQE